MTQIPATEPGSFYQPLSLPAMSASALDHRHITRIVQRPRKPFQPLDHLWSVDTDDA